MIKINLIPKEIRSARTQRQIQSVLLVSLVLVGVLFVGYYLQLLKQSSALTQELADARTQLQVYEAIDAEIRAAQAKEQELNARLSVVKDLLKGTLTYPRFYEDFMERLPNDVWVSNLTTTTDASYGLAVTVNATSLSAFGIADWLTALQGSERFSGVSMGPISVSEPADSSPALYTFTLTFQYARKEPS